MPAKPLTQTIGQTLSYAATPNTERPTTHPLTFPPPLPTPSLLVPATNHPLTRSLPAALSPRPMMHNLHPIRGG